LYIKSGQTYKVRPLSIDTVYEYFSYYHRDEDNKHRYAIGPDPRESSLASAHEDIKVSRKQVCYIFDREDGEMKVMVSPVTVLDRIREQAAMTETDPGSAKDGGDFKIGSSGSGKDTKYAVAFIGKTPLTDEEMKAIQDAKENGLIKKLSTFFEPLEADALNNRLFGELSDNSSSGTSNVVGDIDINSPTEGIPSESNDNILGDFG